MKIKLNDLCMTYPGKKKALMDVNLEISSPNLVGLVGPNGAGKSTLMKLLVSRLLQTSGTISVDGKPLEKNIIYVKQRLGYLPQDFGLYDELSVYQFLDYMAVLKGFGKNSRSIIEKTIEKTHLSEKRNARIRTLSGGQKQRVGIAQALLGNPELLILDEPTVGLDPEERVSFRNLFSLNARDKIVILSTHIIDDVQSVCNRLVVINKGMILFNGEPAALIRSAEGHVGVFETDTDNIPALMNGFKVVSRVLTTRGVQFRIVSPDLPDYARPVTPSLEDAYMYLMAEEGGNGEPL